jgi:hypothetical protein
MCSASRSLPSAALAKKGALAFLAEKTVFRTCKNEGMRYSMQCIYQGFSNGLFCLKI